MIVLFVSNAEPKMNFTLVMFTIGVSCMGGLYSGWITNPQVGHNPLQKKKMNCTTERFTPQDISPNFAGTVLGLTNCIGSIPGFVAPRVASEIVNADPTDVSK